VTFIDSNVLIDVFDDDPRWASWSLARVEEETAEAGASINAVVVAELSPGYASLGALLSRLESVSIAIAVFDEEAAFVAGRAFSEYRKTRQGGETRVLADFMIGAHASVLAVPLLTRDPAVYRRYFPELPLITPENRP
jgi:predicted nucleic acid-binding protein